MGTQVDTQNGNNFEYTKAVKKYLEILLKKQFSIIKRFDCFFKHTNDYKLLRQLVITLHDFTNSVIRRRREELMQNAELLQRNENTDSGAKRKEVFLNLLLQVKDEGVSLSDEDIREEVDTFMFEVTGCLRNSCSFLAVCFAVGRATTRFHRL